MNNSQTTLDDLAAMVKKGFDETGKDLAELKSDVSQLKTDVNELQAGQERIEMRLTNVAYRFELQELQQRVERLEQKAGIWFKSFKFRTYALVIKITLSVISSLSRNLIILGKRSIMRPFDRLKETSA